MSYQASETTATSGPRTTVPSFSLEIDGSVALLLAASMIQMIAAANLCDLLDSCTGTYAYAVAAGVISVAICIVYILGMKFAPSLASPATPVVALFLLVWWAVAAGYLTFKRPFKDTGNGYFASWLAFGTSVSFAFGSVSYVKSAIERMHESSIRGGKQRQMVAFVLVASIVQLIAASIEMDADSESKKHQKGWVVACGTISIVLCSVFLFVRPLSPFLNFFGIFLAIWWGVGVGVGTFDAPFKNTGNGYFASWAAFLSSAYLAVLSFMGSDEIV